MIGVFDTDNFYQICDSLGERDGDLQSIINAYGYPPIWSREPGFATLIHIILEQQVSLASALAAMNKLQERLETVTPEICCRCQTRRSKNATSAGKK